MATFTVMPKRSRAPVRPLLAPNPEHGGRGLGDVVGKVVESVHVGDDRVLLFTLADGTAMTFVAVGDCCSSSWFEHVDSFDFKGEVLRWDAAAEPERESTAEADVADSGKNDDHILVDFTTFYTASGRLHVEMRNSSNGYYSGWVESADQATVSAVKTWRLAE